MLPLVFLITAFSATAAPLETSPDVPLPIIETSPLWRRQHKTSLYCSIRDDSPYIAPTRTAIGRMSGAFVVNPDGNGTIAGTPDVETLFEYTLDPWVLRHHADGAPRMCALFFRLPVCTDLPEGYPCFAWTGLEQQVLGDGGMRFQLVYDSHAGRVPPPGGSKKEWEATDLVQVFPGDGSDEWIAGMFPCLVDRDRAVTRNVSFVATATEGWGLGFAQGGVGAQRDVDTRLGVGAFVVGCGSDTEDGPAW